MTRRILLALLVVAASAGCLAPVLLQERSRGIDPGPVFRAISDVAVLTLVAAAALLQLRPGLLPDFPGFRLRGHAGFQPRHRFAAVLLGSLAGVAAFCQQVVGGQGLLLLLPAASGFRALRRPRASAGIRTCVDAAVLAFGTLAFRGSPASVAGAVATTLLLATLLPRLQVARALERAGPGPAAAPADPRGGGAPWALPATALLAALLFLALPRNGSAPVPGSAVSARRGPPLPGDGPPTPGDRVTAPSARRVSIGEIGRLQQDFRPFLEVTVLRNGRPGDAEDLGPLFRSGALEEFDGADWVSRDERGRLLVDGDDGASDGLVVLPRRRLPAGEVVEQRLRYLVEGYDSLFCLGIPIAVGGPGARGGVLLVGRGEARVPVAFAEGATVTIRSVVQGGDYPAVDGELLSDARRERLLAVPPGHGRTEDLARGELGGGGPGTGRALLRRVERFLARRCRYSLDVPPRGEATATEAFLFDARRGHCELFASAAAVMLRSLGVPARLVIGFRGGILDPATRRYTLRGADAHAWVEAWFEGQGWISCDPTPAARPPSADCPDPATDAAGEGNGPGSRGLLDGLLRYDGEAQRRLLGDVVRGAGLMLHDAFLGPDGGARIPVIATLVLAFGLLGWALLRRPGTPGARDGEPAAKAPPPPVPEAWLLLLQRLEAAGIRRAPTETGRELAARAEGAGVRPAGAALRLAEAYAAERFGARHPSPAEDAALRALAGSVAPPAPGPRPEGGSPPGGLLA